jgi:phospholipase/lecithinase/hemolysin
MVRQQGGIRFAVGPLVCLLAGFLSIFLFGRSAALAATPFSDLIVFGDSLSDNGNAGRFSNGPVWAERIAERMGLDLRPARSGGTNYAIGGARTHGGLTDVLSQTAAYLARRSVDPDALYIVFAGANDLLAAACRGNDVADDSRVARQAAEAIGTATAQLAAAGAVHVLVPNLPDVGRAPVVRARGPECADTARSLTQKYNVALDEVLEAVEADTLIRLLRLDVFSLAEQVFADPQRAGFHDVTTPCLGRDCDGVLFWDPLHPTAAAHSLLAQEALRALGIGSP